MLAVKYTYDALNRLVREDNKQLKKTWLYSYDNNGNILGKREFDFTSKDKTLLDESNKNIQYAYDRDRLLLCGGKEFEYDALGNPTVYLGKECKWAKGRQLAEIVTEQGTTTFAYDGQGRRIQKGDITFTYDSEGKLIRQSNGLSFLYDHEGVVGVEYNNSTYFYRRNAQGDIIAILDNSGAVVVKYVYDAWGNHDVEVLDSTCTALSELNPYLYRGYYYDTETGLYYLKTRYYDPEVGRFITIDDLSYLDPDAINGLNLYAYCGNNPVMDTDETGALPKWLRVLVGVVAIVAAVVVSVVTAGTAAPVLIGMGIGAALGGGFELGKQLVAGGPLDWGAIGWAAFGGAVAGAVSAMPVFQGFGIGSYLGTAAVGGVASVAGGVVSGSVTNVTSLATAFALGAIGNVAAKGVQHFKINHTTNKVMNMSSAKARSRAINDYFTKHNVKPMGLGHNSFGGWSVNLFKDMSKEFFKSVVTDMVTRSATWYSCLISSTISGWF